MSGQRRRDDMARAEWHKLQSKGQTDQRIVKLTFKAFEEEFGFKPDDKIEQRHFATHRERLTNPQQRAMGEKQDKSRKAAAKARSE